MRCSILLAYSQFKIFIRKIVELKGFLWVVLSFAQVSRADSYPHF